MAMSTSRKLKSHGIRRGKNRTPHKGVKRGGIKRKYRKGSLKSRKRGDDANRTYRSHI
ncbi:spermatid nuclear transition protein 1 [Octodon degus]|uniref:Spermatid nuclear transition protein 1 n=1 Tax=Octodon degus TaxID=10160 RepID=A0A6P3F9F1_OCTDE|nr:spermatid nuclear transition protein 1 [Octodon degus]